jgi:hypothetical protein
MSTIVIVVVQPIIQIDLQLFDWPVYLAPEGNLVELLQDRLVKAHTDAVGLGRIGEWHRRYPVSIYANGYTLIKGHQERKPPTHAQLIRAKLIDEVTPVRALLKALTDLPWAATDNHLVTAAMTLLQGLPGTSRDYMHRISDSRRLTFRSNSDRCGMPRSKTITASVLSRRWR